MYSLFYRYLGTSDFLGLLIVQGHVWHVIFRCKTVLYFANHLPIAKIKEPTVNVDKLTLEAYIIQMLPFGRTFYWLCDPLSRSVIQNYTQWYKMCFFLQVLPYHLVVTHQNLIPHKLAFGNTAIVVIHQDPVLRIWDMNLNNKDCSHPRQHLSHKGVTIHHLPLLLSWQGMV